MKRILLLLLLAALTACAPHYTRESPEKVELFKTWWRAEEINGVKAMFMPGQKMDVHIILYPSRRMVGSGGCNQIHASFTRSAGTIRFGPVSSTRMACAPAIMSRERAFIEAFRKVETFTVDGLRLRMYDHAGSEVLRFHAVDSH
jgi:heat shock protein HslJ